jgi:hypothetical protein
MYFRDRAEPAAGYPSLVTGIVLVLLAAVVLLLGVLPAPVMALVQ